MGDDMTRRDLLKDLALAGGIGAAGAAVAAEPARAAGAQPATAGATREGGVAAGAGKGGPPLNASVAAWRKAFASLRDGEEVCCWYIGTMFLRPPGVPEIPVMHAETIMVYRASALADGSTQMRWIEIGRFLDPLTGRPTDTWLNPFTGRRVPMPRSFITEPSSYHVRGGADALSVRLDQHDARVENVETRISAQGGRVWVHQTERKVRGVPSDSTEAAVAGRPRSLTQLALAVDQKEIDDPQRLSAAASGSYSFETDALPAWAGIGGAGSTIVRGIMQKAATDVRVNAEAWDALRTLYPQFFSGDKVAPRWE
jgi:hypothetical protein